MKTLTKLISLSICGILLVGCSDKAQDNTTKTTNDNNTTASTTNAQDVNKDANSSSTTTPATTSTNTTANNGEVDLTNLVKDSKQIYDIIVAKYPSATLLSDDEKKLIKDYNDKYGVINNHKAKDDEEFKNQTIYCNIIGLYEDYVRYSDSNVNKGDKRVIEASKKGIDRVLHDVSLLNP